MPAKPKLKLYCISNLDGRHSAIIAAPTKAAACEAMGVTGVMKAHVSLINGNTNPLYVQGCTLAMATPGIRWRREQHWSPSGPEPQWICSDELAGARAIVRMRFPAAVAMSDEDGPGKGIWVGDFGRAIGSGPTASAAWFDAARILSIDPPPGLPENAIVVWRFEDAPEAFRQLHPEKVAWIAFVPPRFENDWLGWLDRSSVMIERYPVRGGEVRIGLG